MKVKNMTLYIKKIRYKNPETKFAVFQADIMKKSKRTNEFSLSKKEAVFIGQIFALYPGDKVEVQANEYYSPIYGKEWHVQTYHRIAPGTLEELERFLLNMKGLGPVKVKKILDIYGLDTLEVIRNDFQALKVIGVPEDVSKSIQKEMIENNCFEELLSFMYLNDLDFRYALPIYKKYGTIAMQRIQNNPYALYFDSVIDFQTADKLSHAMKNSGNLPERIKAGIIACLRNDAECNGNLFLPYEQLPEALEAFLKRQKAGYRKNTFKGDELANGISSLAVANFIQTDVDKATGSINVYLREHFWAETKIISTLERLNDSPKRFAYQTADIDQFLDDYSKQTKMNFADAQKEAVHTALQNHISIITGGPGTGKSQTINTVIAAIRKLSPHAVIKIGAPTGKAALRVSELSNMDASTIHRMLHMGGHLPPVKDEELECDFLIIDEFSMVDCFLCAKLFQAAASYARIVIVGDHEQLPSVGPGLVLRDMINSEKIPVTRLTRIFRQKKQSRIADNAHEIIRHHQEGEQYNLKVSHKPTGDFYFLKADDPRKIQEIICHSVKNLMDHFGYTLGDIKILSPIHQSDLGTAMLNTMMQQTFNPNGEIYERDDGLEIRKGDPVIQLHNNYDINVFNGESGVVTALGYDPEKTLLVEFPDGRHIWYNSMEVDDLDLAYAITTHKSQGSEFKAVIMPVHQQLVFGMNKNLLYTGITRAKEKVVIVGNQESFSLGLRREIISKRNSNLISRIQEKF